ncbi:MAG TPA: 2-oxo acid dehydrogenase subunit E2 [Actinocrinis sp.]|nr:2-oxo acid dehydrogenase subunit E2 [Actinocrinis sp.]
MGAFTMPTLGADMTEGTLVEWLVQPGAPVHKGDVIAVVDTAKSAIEVECFESGTVTRLLVEPGMSVPVGTPLALIDTVEPAQPQQEGPVREEPAALDGAGAAAVAAQLSIALPPPTPIAPAPPPAAPTAPMPPPTAPPGISPIVRHLAEEKGIDLTRLTGSGRLGRITRADVAHAAAPHRLRITPYARRLAAELGVDAAALHGTGTQGAVRAADVRAAAAVSQLPAPALAPAAVPSATPAPTRTTAQDRALAMRLAIGALMSRSKREIPHYYLSTTIDLGRTLEWMREHNRRVPVTERLVPAALLLKAAAMAAREVPQLNGFWLQDRFVPADGVQLGVAVSLRGGGLIAPALHDADEMALPELMAALKDLVERARAGRLRSSETTDPTLTVTNLGDQGVDAVYGVIYPPQVALVGFGKIIERPCAVDGLLGVRPCVTATLSADHRASDGAVGARYLAAVDRLLRKPEEL